MSGWPDFKLSSNAENGGWGMAPTSAVPATLEAPTTPAVAKASQRMRLHCVGDVKRELRRLYVEARNGTIKSADATKLAYLLNMLANLMVDSDLEERVNAVLGESKGK